MTGSVQNRTFDSHPDSSCPIYLIFVLPFSQLALPSDNKMVLQRVSGYEEVIKAPVSLQLSLYCLWFNCH